MKLQEKGNIVFSNNVKVNIEGELHIDENNLYLVLNCPVEEKNIVFKGSQHNYHIERLKLASYSSSLFDSSKLICKYILLDYFEEDNRVSNKLTNCSSINLQKYKRSFFNCKWNN